MKKQILIKAVIAGITTFGLFEFSKLSYSNWLFWVIPFVISLLFNPYIFIIMWDGIKESVREIPQVLALLVSSKQKQR